VDSVAKFFRPFACVGGKCSADKIDKSKPK